jgi:PAS domain S-box-containing protein
MAVGAALGVQKGFSHVWPPDGFPFTVFYPAVVLAGWYGRLGPALAATLLSLLAAGWSVGLPNGGFAFGDPAHAVEVATDGIVALCLALAIEGMHRANDRAVQEFAGRKQADQALRESQEVFAKAFRASPEGLVISRISDGLVYEVNDSWLRLFGLQRRDAVGHTSEELQLFGSSEERLRAVEQLVHDGGLRDFALEIKATGGELRPVLLSAEYIEIQGEACLLTIIRDVSAQTRAAREVRESAERIRLVSVATGVTLFQQDTALRYVWVHNPFPGYAADMLVGRTDEQIAPAVDDLAALVEAKWSVLRTGRGTRTEVVSRGPDGRRTVYEAVLEPLVDSAGRTVGLLGASIDVTLRREADAQLKAREEQLRFVTDHAAVMIVQCDAAGRYTFANRPFAARYGLQPAELVGRHMGEVLGPEACAELAPHLASVLRGERAEFEICLPYPHITPRWTHCVWVPQKDEGGSVIGFVAVIQDVTVRKAVEDALRESERRFRSMANGLPLLVWVHDAKGQQEFVNQTFCDFFGVTLEEMRGGRWQLLLHPDDVAAYSSAFLAAVEARRPFHGEVRVRRADGEWRSIESWAQPRISTAGGYLGMVGASVDITERKRAERQLETARDEAVAASRAKDDFFALLSHELRTPLSPVLLIASEAANDLSLPPAVRSDFETIAQNIGLEARLIDDLLDLNRIVRRKVTIERELLDAHAVLRDAARGVQEDADAKQVRLEFALAASRVAVLGDPVRLRQVFWNVLKNAVKFTPSGGRVTLATANDAARGELEVRIQDTGIGMTTEELARVFEPFAQGEHSRQGESGYGGL